MAVADADRPPVEGEGSQPSLSIIMPCYNVAGFLPQAFRGIQAQTYGAWELICVDDGSTDGTPDAIRQAAAGDPRIRLVSHARNQGLAAARNTGLADARGGYVWMPDPDDGYDPDLLERAVARLERDGSDFALFGCVEELRREDGSLASVHEVPVPSTVACEIPLEGAALHAAALDLEEATLLGYAWNKVYRRSSIKGIEFEDVPLIEDILFNISVLDAARRVSVVDGMPYRYVKRLGANLTNRFVPRYFEVHRRRIGELYDQQRRWGRDTVQVRSRLGSLFGRYILSSLERNCDARAGMSGAARARWVRELFEDPLFQALIPAAHAQGDAVLEACLAMLRRRSVTGCLALGRSIHVVRGGAGGLYSKLKQGR